MNNYLREILVNKIKKVLGDSISSSKLSHPSLTGKYREALLIELIEPLLNSHYSIGTGKIIDYKGTTSKETDICIYSNNIHPPFFFPTDKKLAIFPFESVLTCIEVKSTFNEITLRDAYEKFQFLEKNLQMTSGFHNSDEPMAHSVIKPQFDFFAFHSVPKNYSPEYILNTYKKIDPEWDSNPLITSICIANKGWICNTQRGWYHMSFDHKNKINEEIIGYLCTLIQGLPNKEYSRGFPRIGYYLTNTYDMDKIKNGKKIKNTWRKKSITFSNAQLITTF